jgi:holo-[acyl-carrier protein] synthase
VSDDDGVVASRLELVEIQEVAAMLGQAAEPAVFSEAELRFARGKSDPVRRLAARLAAKRAAAALLGDGIGPEDVEVARRPGRAPELRLSPRGQRRLRELGADRALVSLTHGREQAAAAVLLLRGGR